MDNEEYGAAGLAFIAGAFAGAAIALLYAPYSGRRTRRKLAYHATRAWDHLTDSKERLNERVSELLDTIALYSEELVRKGQAIGEHERKRLADSIAMAREELERLRHRIARLD